MSLQERGSYTAKTGFKNEDDVIEQFNHWKTQPIAQEWLMAMNYNLDDIEDVKAFKIKGHFKADMQLQISVTIKLKKLLDVQNIQVKLVSNTQGFNQIDKRWVDKYVELWDIPENITKILKYFTGELEPKIPNSKDKRRMFANEFTICEQDQLIKFITDNKTLIVSDILKKRGTFAAEWMLVILKIKQEEIKWTLKPINFCLNLFSHGDIIITPKGSIRLGHITIQRKGGDGGRKTANMLQFKINPLLLFER